MRLRLAIGAFLIVVGIVLPVVVAAKRGAPWSFRGHNAVVLEITGAVELQTADGSPIKAGPGAFLNAGDHVRVPRYGEARLRLPNGDVVIGDATNVAIDEKGVTIGSGVVEVDLPKGASPPFEVKAEGVTGTIIPRPGGSESGIARVLVDKNGEMRAYAAAGSIEGVIKDGPDESAESGKVIVVSADRKVRVEGGPSGPIAPTWTCDAAKHLSLQVPAGTQVFVAKAVAYPKGGTVAVDVPDANPGVLVRDLAGNAWHKEVPCPSVNAPPEPPPPPPPPTPPGKTPKPPKPKPKTP